jgi:hypothetical protein
VQPRAVEVLDSLGIADKIVAESYRAKGLRILRADTEVGRIEPNVAMGPGELSDQPYRGMVLANQAVAEKAKASWPRHRVAAIEGLSRVVIWRGSQIRVIFRVAGGPPHTKWAWSTPASKAFGGRAGYEGWFVVWPVSALWVWSVVAAQLASRFSPS